MLASGGKAVAQPAAHYLPGNADVNDSPLSNHDVQLGNFPGGKPREFSAHFIGGGRQRKFVFIRASEHESFPPHKLDNSRKILRFGRPRQWSVNALTEARPKTVVSYCPETP
jgi:hypothetical protein